MKTDSTPEVSPHGFCKIALNFLRYICHSLSNKVAILLKMTSLTRLMEQNFSSKGDLASHIVCKGQCLYLNANAKMAIPRFPNERKLIAYKNATKNTEYDNVYIFIPIF